MLREKDLSFEERLSICSKIAEYAKPFEATLVVSGDTQIGIRPDVGGVHAPGHCDPADVVAALGSEKLVGYSAHSPSDVLFAQSRSADYVTLSPIFPSDSKPGYGPPIGLEVLRLTTRSADTPVVALGGISTRNARDCIEAGAAGIAVMGEVMRAEDPAAVFRAFNDKVTGKGPVR